MSSIAGLDRQFIIFQSFFAATVPLVTVLSGIIGGLVLTVVAIFVVLLVKRSKTTHHCGKNGGSDIVVISKDINKGSDGVSNNSSEMKVEVRTSSSLSNGEDQWEGSDDSGPLRRQIILPKSVDFVDGHQKPLVAATLPPYNKAEAVRNYFFDDRLLVIIHFPWLIIISLIPSCSSLICTIGAINFL